jgi:hypothetical protein
VPLADNPARIARLICRHAEYINGMYLIDVV